MIRMKGLNMKILDKFLKFLQTDRNTFFTYVFSLITVYIVIDRLVEFLLIVFTLPCLFISLLPLAVVSIVLLLYCFLSLVVFLLLSILSMFYRIYFDKQPPLELFSM